MNSEKANLLIVSVFTHYHALLGSLPASLNQSKEAWCALMNLGQLLASLVRQNTFLEPETPTATVLSLT